MEVCTLFQCNFNIPVISAQYDQCDGPAYQHLIVTSCTRILHSIFWSEKAPIPKLSEKKISILSIHLFISSVPKISARTCNPLFGVLDQRVRRPGKAHTSNYPSENTFIYFWKSKKCKMGCRGLFKVYLNIWHCFFSRRLPQIFSSSLWDHITDEPGNKTLPRTSLLYQLPAKPGTRGLKLWLWKRRPPLWHLLGLKRVFDKVFI